MPVLLLFYLLVGRRWVASYAGAAGAALAILLAWLVFGMPADKAMLSFVNGAAFGLLPIGWTVFGDAPSLVMILGALLIVGAGLAILPGRARPGPVAEPRAKPSEAVAGPREIS